MIGRVLRETYRITRPIREGGMGQLFEAENVRLSELRYVVKVLHERLSPRSPSFEHFYARFRREAKLIAELRHPNIVKLLDFDTTDDGIAFLVMEWLDGEDLRDRLEREPRLPTQVVAQLVAELGGALQFAHERGIIHRDLKPSNVFLERLPHGDFRVRLLDFGLAKKVDLGATPLTVAQSVLGTPKYMSPEQARGETVTTATDIFSFATLAYLCLSGSHPFSGEDAASIRASVCNSRPPPVAVFVPSLPRAVDAVLERAHRKQPAERYLAVTDFTRDLFAALEMTAPRWLPEARPARTEARPASTEDRSLTEASSTVGPALAELPRVGRTRPGAVALAVLALLLGVVVGGVVLLRSRPIRPPPISSPEGGANAIRRDDLRIATDREPAVDSRRREAGVLAPPGEPDGGVPAPAIRRPAPPRQAPASGPSPRPTPTPTPKKKPFDDDRLRYNEI